MPISNLPPIFPVPVLPQSFDTSLSYYELLAKLTESMNNIASTVNSLSSAVTVLQSTVFQIQEQVGDIPELTAAVTQLQTDLTAEIQNRQTQYDSLYTQINGVRNLVIADYVSNEDLDERLGGGINLTLISRADYDELTEYDDKTIYFVQDADEIKMYYNGSELVAAMTGDAYTALNGGIAETINGTAEEVNT